MLANIIGVVSSRNETFAESNAKPNALATPATPALTERESHQKSNSNPPKPSPINP